MSQSPLKQRLLSADFRPHTLAPGLALPDLVSAASSEAQAGLRLAWDGSSVPALKQALGTEWPRLAIEVYWQLPPKTRMEILGVDGFYIHETMHKLDFLITPFAASFHGRACLELLDFQEASAPMLRELKLGHDPACSIERPSDDEFVLGGPASFVARVRWFDAIRGASPQFVEPGWGTPVPFVLHGRSLETVFVHDVMPSVTLPNAPDRYLRPLTIMESRAVAVTALALYHRLGGGDQAAREIARYIQTFYSPPESYPDYAFLLDLFAQAWQEDDFSQAIESNGSAWLEGSLLMIIIMGWYALQAPPLMDREQMSAQGNSSPIARLLLVLLANETAMRRGTPFEHGVAFLEHVDGTEAAQALGVLPIEEVLEYSARWVAEIRSRNAERNTHDGLRRHFDRILRIVERQLRLRSQHSYASRLGMPDGGAVLNGFRDEADLDELLLESYAPEPEVARWFALRENLNFRYSRTSGFWDEVEQYVSPPTY